MNAISAFKNLSLTRFLEEIDNENFFWIAKRLSGNDTGLNGGHQAGVYFSRRFFEIAFPEICRTDVQNPDFYIDQCYFPGNDYSSGRLRAIYYNSSLFPVEGQKNTRNEFRLTRWGGASSPVLNVENTGCIFILALHRDSDGVQSVCWVSSSLSEEVEIEEWLGEEVEPGRFYMKQNAAISIESLTFPESWFDTFPKGREIFNFVVSIFPYGTSDLDSLLLKRRGLEYQIFRHLESLEVLPKIKSGFDSVEDFIRIAHSVSNRRKSRAGSSLELNLESIFQDVKIAFEREVVTELKKKPDFVFPSAKAYHSSEFSVDDLHMLAAKTSCKERWRQVKSEAGRIELKHLFTLQQGVSSNQLTEMKDSRIQLVVPGNNLHYFPADWRSSIYTLTQFVEFIREHQVRIENLSQWTS
jgi:type II restriction enzyme